MDSMPTGTEHRSRTPGAVGVVVVAGVAGAPSPSVRTLDLYVPPECAKAGR